MYLVLDLKLDEKISEIYEMSLLVIIVLIIV